MDMDHTVPTPGEWHPWYEQQRENPALLHWLQSDDQRPLTLPVQYLLEFGDGDGPAIPAYPTLHQRLAYSGPREYRDRLANPGLNWYVGTDQYGRSVSGRPFAAPL